MDVRGRATELLQAAVGERFTAPVETAIFDWCTEYADETEIEPDGPMFDKLYVSKALEIIENLDPASYVRNTYLRGALLDGTVDAKNLPYMTPQQLFPALWTELVDKIKTASEAKYAHKVQATTDEYECGKCGSRKCTSFYMQTRSIDEPSTLFVTCVECGHNFRF